MKTENLNRLGITGAAAADSRAEDTRRHTDTSQFSIDLSERASVARLEISEGIALDYDGASNLAGTHVDNACTKVELKRLIVSRPREQLETDAICQYAQQSQVRSDLRQEKINDDIGIENFVPRRT